MGKAGKPPFCPAPNGGRFVVDVTGPFLAKFGGLVVPHVAMVAAVIQQEGPRVIAAMGPPGAGQRSQATRVGAIEALAGMLGATPWPQDAGAEQEGAEAALVIVDGLSVEDIAAQLPHALAGK